MTMTRIRGSALLLAVVMAGCGGGEAGDTKPASTPVAAGAQTFTVRDSLIAATVEAAGVAEPIERATLSTKLMGSITVVLVREGDRVARGQVLARIDARDLVAKRAQIDAGISAAEAMYQDARTQAERFRALYADSAATRFQLDQAETGLARADAGLRTARASGAELDAVGAYAEVRAPFAGIITRRFVDAGAFVAPGAPIVEVQNDARLRISVTVPPQSSAALRKGQPLEAIIEGRAARAIVEGAVPAPGAAVYTVNAIVDNADGTYLPGSAATLAVPAGARRAILIPIGSLVHEGDLTGVRVQTGAVTELRWVKVGAIGSGPMIEVFSGLMSGDVILLGGH
jgi:RND family efflux transporter MFP subunit